MNDFDSLMSDLFGKTTQQPEPEIKIKPVKEKEQINFFPYRPENLKNKLSEFLSKLKQAGASYTVTNIQSGYTFNNTHRVKIICKDNTLLETDLMREIHNDIELESLLILNFIQYSDFLFEKIEGLATYRIYRRAEERKYFPSSLFLAVLSVFKNFSEYPNAKHKTIEEIYEDYITELKSLGIEYPAIVESLEKLRKLKIVVQRVNDNCYIFKYKVIE